MACGYAVLFFSVFQSRFRWTLFLLMACSAVSAMVNLLYDIATSYQPVMVAALVVRLLPPLESCWLVAGNEKHVRHALAVFSFVVIQTCTTPQAISAYPYLTLRTVATIGVACVCLLTSAANFKIVMSSDHMLVRNLHLQSLWICLHSLISLFGGWITQTWPRYIAVRVAYVFAAFAIVYLYVRMLRSPVAQLAAAYPSSPRRWNRLRP